MSTKIMIRFHEFLKENNIELDTSKLTYQEFLKSVKDSCIKDFSMTKTQALELTILYRDLFKDAWERGLTIREAIASTKRPGVIIKDDIIEESNILDIDNIYEAYIEFIENETNPDNIKSYVDDYFNRFNESYSDKRIYERTRNNYIRLKKLADKKIFEKDYVKDDMTIDVDVLERNDELIDKIINVFSFVYKKIKNRYLRPIKITGKTLYKDVELEITLSNNDIVKITWDDRTDTDELKVHINDKLVYHLDYIDDIDIVEKASQLYDKYLQRQNFKINKKINPFD